MNLITYQANEKHTDQINTLYDQESFNSYFSKHSHETFITEKYGKIIGAITTSHQNNAYYIENIAVNSKHRRSGIGSALLNHVKKIAKQKNMQAVEMWTPEEEFAKFNDFKTLTHHGGCHFRYNIQ